MEINEICKLEGWPINHPVLTRDNIGPCYCSCSCLAFGTMVEDGTGGFKAIENYAVGDEIMASGTGLSWTSKPVVFSGGTTGASRQKFTVLVLYGETALAVTSDHLFLLAGDEHTLKRADRLSPDDVLISPSGEPVSVTAVHIGDYLAGFHHVAASDKEAPPEDLEGHLLNTNGVVSADYVVQITARRTDVAGFKVKQHDDMPVVGSAEYVERYGRGCLEAPELPDAVTSRTPLRASGFNAPDLDLAQYTFVPADATRVIVPDHACGFLSPEEAEAKARSPKRPFNDPLAREWTEALIQQHKTFYPDVTYSLDWASDEVNAYAWVENNVRHVALKGGLVRDQDLELEGIALVLAHELAHHYGGTPTFPSGLSCEGQADYRGVRNIMRKVWFGDSYITTTDAAIAQMANFFGVPNDPHAPAGSAGCGHPPGACRVATYHSAVSLAGKPVCAA
ncbi:MULTISPECIES: Hint domain-containing protein [unclassified Streptomyces]|uniref:Hint domain-containing protein n=1 Tax=unclassified Streptomyces TaxID=2593676 RepID=UPI002DD89512|nr:MULTISPECIES: Hint domain-containing protein [unclassified Streptomyces]WSA90942.1 hypothetical protein OIE63_04840 [Streptomyces sp. NBC_01795]WSB75266.1 hypothetical protein OHB04_05380 [Streptomyces sp. NBC_01775]WSS16451.1 hypothetical protein OG533_34525 [Streptomyces sp. NBC_01186]WSS45269.1 hypothetical protein OG220_35205 [Streptomyces sp. NBC_01187]